MDVALACRRPPFPTLFFDASSLQLGKLEKFRQMLEPKFYFWQAKGGVVAWKLKTQYGDAVVLLQAGFGQTVADVRRQVWEMVFRRPFFWLAVVAPFVLVWVAGFAERKF